MVQAGRCRTNLFLPLSSFSLSLTISTCIIPHRQPTWNTHSRLTQQNRGGRVRWSSLGCSRARPPLSPPPPPPHTGHGVWPISWCCSTCMAPCRHHMSIWRSGTILCKACACQNLRNTRIHHHCGYPLHPTPHMIDLRLACSASGVNAYQTHLCKRPGNRDRHTGRQCGLWRSTQVPHSF